MCRVCWDLYHKVYLSHCIAKFNPYPTKLFYLNFHPLEVVPRYRDRQLQGGENYLYLFNLKQTMANPGF